MSISGYRREARFPTEESFETYFSTQVAPLRERLDLMPLGRIPSVELQRAVFVYEYGYDVGAYYQHRAYMNDYDRAQLDKYVQRQIDPSSG